MKTQPKFTLSPNKLRVLYEPEQFYRTLLVSLTLFILLDILARCNIGYDQAGAAPDFPFVALHRFLGD